jgi:hypothetical protein
MEIVQSIAQLKANASQKQEGYVDFVLSKGKVEGDQVILSADAQLAIHKKYPTARPREISLAALQASAPYQPPGYVDFVMSRAKIDGDKVILDEKSKQELWEKFPQPLRPLLYRLADLKANTALLPESYIQFLYQHGKISGDYLILEAKIMAKLNPIYRSYGQRVWHKISAIQEAAFKRPPGFLEFVFSKGEISGEYLLINYLAYKEINEKFPAYVTFDVAKLEASRPRRPEGFVDYVLAQGRIEKGHVFLDPSAFKALKERFPNDFTPPPPEPTLTEMASNFAGAMTGWAKAGFKTVEREVYEKREAICLACSYWDGKARGGLGKCKICGCARVKLWLTTSKCPHKPAKW